MFWNHAIWRIPARLMMAGTHSPTMAMPQLVMPAGWAQPNSAST